MTLDESLARAKANSLAQSCTQHVTASPKLFLIDGRYAAAIPADAYGVSDWFDGTVIATFTNGKEH